MVEYSGRVCVKCGETLTKYFPREIENFIRIKHDEFNRNEPAYRCDNCGMIFQFDWSEMGIEGKMEKSLMVFGFKIDQEDMINDKGN